MRKYYGPIVLGLAALTVAAPITNATTVLAAVQVAGGATENVVAADTAASSNEITSCRGEITDFQKTLNDYNGTTPSVTATQKNIIDLLASIDGKKSIKESDITVWNNKLISDQNAVKTVKPMEYTVSIKLTSDNTIKKLTLKNIPVEPNNITTNIDVSKIEKDLTGTLTLNNGEFTSTSTDFTIKDGTDTTTDDNIEFIDKTNRIISAMNRIESSESAGLAEKLGEAVKGAKDKATTAEQLETIHSNTNKTIADDITEININTYPCYIPKVNNKTIYARTAYDNEEIALTFKDEKLTTAEIVDSTTHEIIPTNTRIAVWDSKDAIGNPIVNTNKPISKPANTNNYQPAKKPVAKPTHTKTIKENHMVFYATPDNNLNLYTEDGEIITNRALGANTSWLADKLMDLDGLNYVRVATDEWARLADGLEINNQIGIITTKNDSALFTADGTRITNRALGKNTAWRTDMSATINGQTMYRVATNEWINAVDLK